MFLEPWLVCTGAEEAGGRPLSLRGRSASVNFAYLFLVAAPLRSLTEVGLAAVVAFS